MLVFRESLRTYLMDGPKSNLGVCYLKPWAFLLVKSRLQFDVGGLGFFSKVAVNIAFFLKFQNLNIQFHYICKFETCKHGARLETRDQGTSITKQHVSLKPL